MWSRVPLMHMSAYHICKRFPGLLPKAQYHRLLHMYGFWAFFNGPKKWKSCSDKFRVYAGCLSTSHQTASSLSCTLLSHTQTALSSGSVSPPISLSRPVFLILAWSFWTICQWWFGPTVSLCDCREADVPWCPSGTAWMDSPPGVPSLRSAAVPSVLVTLTWLSCSTKNVCQCIYWVKLADVSFTPPLQCHQFQLDMPR